QRVDQLLRGDHPTCLQRQHGQQPALLGPCHLDGPSLPVEHLELTEPPDPHAPTVPPFPVRGSASGQRRISPLTHDAYMDPISHALLALMAAGDGDTAAAEAHLTTAQREARTSARRDRQIVEIAALV